MVLPETHVAGHPFGCPEVFRVDDRKLARKSPAQILAGLRRLDYLMTAAIALLFAGLFAVIWLASRPFVRSSSAAAVAAVNVRELHSLSDLRADFNAHTAQPRLIFLLSPT